MKTLLSAVLVVACVCTAAAQTKKISEMTFTNRWDDDARFEVSSPNGTGWVTRATSKQIALSNATARGNWTFTGKQTFSATGTNLAFAQGGTDKFTIETSSSGPTFSLNSYHEDGAQILNFNAGTEELLIGEGLTLNLNDASISAGASIKAGTVFKSSSGLDGLSGTQAGLQFESGLWVGGTWSGTNPVVATATNAIGNNGGFGTNTTLYGTTLALGSGIIAHAVRATNFQSRDGSFGTSASATGFELEQGIITTAATPTGGGALMLSNAPVANNPTFKGTVTGDASTGFVVDVAATASQAASFRFNSVEMFRIDADGSVDIGESGSGALEVNGTANISGNVNVGGLLTAPTNGAALTLLSNGPVVIASGTVFTNNGARSWVTFEITHDNTAQGGANSCESMLYVQDGGTGNYYREGRFFNGRGGAAVASDTRIGTLTALIGPNSKFYVTNIVLGTATAEARLLRWKNL